MRDNNKRDLSRWERGWLSFAVWEITADIVLTSQGSASDRITERKKTTPELLPTAEPRRFEHTVGQGEWRVDGILGRNSRLGGGGVEEGFDKAWMWHSAPWFGCGGGVRSWVGLNDLKGFFQPGSFCDSLILEVI